MAKIPQANGLRINHIEALELLGTETFQSAHELRELGGSQTIGRSLTSLAKKGYAEVELLERPCLRHKHQYKGRSTKMVLTKTYRATRRGKVAAAKARQILAERAANPPKPAGRNVARGNAPDVSGYGRPSWNLGGSRA